MRVLSCPPFPSMTLPMVLWEDPHLLVAVRPAGLPDLACVQAIATARGCSTTDPLSLVAGAPRPAAAWGLLLVARTGEAARGLTAAIGTGKVRVTYRHLTPAGSRVPGTAGEFRVLAQGRGAVLVEACDAHDLRVEIVERARAASVPVLGDLARPGGARSQRPCLFVHAARMTLAHPITGREVTVESPRPRVFETVLAGERDPTRLALEVALERRRWVVDPASTDAFRVVHGAADGFPGHTVDRFGAVLLVSHRDALDHRLAAALSALPGTTTVLARRLRRDVRDAGPAGLSPVVISGRPVEARFLVREDGVHYLVGLGEGYSSGLFLDQRETRRRIRAGSWMRAGAGVPEVLNTFAYTGTFSVCAALAGARVTTLDLSRGHLDWARENFVANGLDPAAHAWIRGDAFDWLRRLARKGRAFDLVIVDPPTFSTSKHSGAFAVERDYGRLARLAAGVVRPGGTLLSCANSARLPPGTFAAQVEAGCREAGRGPVAREHATQPLDFAPAEGERPYLKISWWTLE